MWMTLRFRLFLSYLVIILVGVITLFGAASWIAGVFFQANIQTILAEKGNTPTGIAALNEAFNDGVHNSLLIAAIASLIAAIIISVFVSARLARPLHEMVNAANRLASGHYEEKVLAPPIHEIAELAAAFNQMAESLQHNEKLRREMVSDLAHELRTPLTVIEGHMEGLIDGVLEPTSATYGRIQREARRLHRLAQELGTLSELDSPNLKLNLEKLPVAEIMEEVLNRVQPQFEFKGITLESSFAGEKAGGSKLEVLADRDRLEQIVINLLANALHYSDTGGHVTFRARRVNKGVEFSIRDTGIGIAPENLSHVFERFYRVDRSRARRGNTGGSGIGLTIVKRLVEAQKGDIWLESEPGKGTEVYFTLPAG
jgi:histidine kinase